MLNESHFLGLDLGQVSDYSALVSFIRSREEPESEVQEHNDPLMGATTIVSAGVRNKDFKRNLAQYRTGGIKRWENQTPYPSIVWDVLLLCYSPPLMNCTLVIDHTGVGRPVVDMFQDARVRGVDCKQCDGAGEVDERTCPICKGARRVKLRANIRPITITAGSGWSVDGSGWRVSKKELVSVLVSLLQSKRLAINPRLEHAKTFVRELESFRVKISSNANETFEAWRERDHDDIVLAAGIAAWTAERGSKEVWIR